MNLIEKATCPTSDYCTIPLTQGQVAKVSEEDYKRLIRWNWYAVFDKSIGGFYVRRNDRNAEGKRYTIRMHREILELGRGDPRMIDHINLDTLDNRRSNLRICSNAENSRNRGNRSDNKSGIKGVYFDKSTGKWRCAITTDGIRKQLGRFYNINDAIKIYQEFAEKYHGEFARCD